MNWLIAICSGIGMLFGLHFVIIGIAGAMKKQRFVPTAEPQKKFAVIVAARNEESVIGELVTSLKNQNYPEKLYDIYVFPNNCSDDTAGAAERAGAKVLFPDGVIRSKGDVLHFAFESLLDAPEMYDAFVIFDADNIVDKDYLQIANDTLVSGAHAGQGYRDSKNPHDNWLTGGMSIFFWMMDSLYNRMRSRIGMAAAFNGTGVMLDREVIRAIGTKTYTMTEDLELCALCALHGYKIEWMEKAVTYDEQPLGFVDSFRQRRRWFAGSAQCFRRYAFRLFACAMQEKNSAAFDMGVIFCGTPVQLISLVPALATITGVISGLICGDIGFGWLAASLAALGIAAWCAASLFAWFVCRMEKKLSLGMAKGIALFPLFLVTWFAANISVFVAGIPKKWKEIQRGTKQNQTLEG
ncbi:MAG: glycosyltransferase [Clostridiales bacterium]|nr:glycosyltransferase [Clostridiales bacterium]